MTLNYLHKKFVVVSDLATRKPLEIFFADGMPDMHSDIFAEAKKRWKKLGKDVIVNGGGRFSVIDNNIVFYGASQAFGGFENDVVAVLAKQHALFSNDKFKIICKAGREDPWELIEENN